LPKLRAVASLIEELGNWAGEGNRQSALSSVFPIEEWLIGARGAIRNAQDTARTATYSPSPEISEQEFRNAVEAIALQEAIDDLLSEVTKMLEDLEAYLNPFGPPHMYVMRDMTPTFKGHEPWAESDPALADSYFSLIVAARRNTRPSSFGPGMFVNANKNGTTCFAQALLYNANSRDMDDPDDKFQPNTGWDTLNWKAPVKAPEWRNGAPSGSRYGHAGGTWPWEWELPTAVFTGMSAGDRAQVRLNWQCKLVPITQNRLKELVDSPESSDSIENAGEFVLDHAKTFLTH
jgi:hypothetical protein